MPPSLKCIASTSDAIFWCGTPAPLFPVAQPIKYVFAFLRLRVRARFWRRLREVATTWPLGDSKSHQGVSLSLCHSGWGLLTASTIVCPLVKSAICLHDDFTNIASKFTIPPLSQNTSLSGLGESHVEGYLSNLETRTELHWWGCSVKKTNVQ